MKTTTIVADKSEITIRFAAAQSASEKHVEPVAAYGIPMEILALSLSPSKDTGAVRLILSHHRARAIAARLLPSAEENDLSPTSGERNRAFIAFVRRRFLGLRHERLLLAFQPLVAFTVVSATLLYPLKATIVAAGLVRVILIEAGVHPCLAGGLA